MAHSHPQHNARRPRISYFEELENREFLAGDMASAIGSIRDAALRMGLDNTVGDSAHTSAPVVAQALSASISKPRLLILTDIGGGDPDDEQSLVRLLTYANEFRIEGIVAGAALNGSNGVDDAKVRNIINHYQSVRNNLSLHSSGYPSADYLRSKVSRGQANHRLFGAGYDTDGSNRIIAAVDASSERLNIAIWGGSADLAQALWRVRNDRSAAQVDEFVAKLRIAWIEQGATDDWIKSNFPDMWVVSNIAAGDSMYQAPFRGMYLGGDTNLATRTWVQQNVKSHRPYGDPYPETAAGAAMKEGDTPTWFYFLPSNLSDPDHPEWGGWGGRYEKNGAIYSPARDDTGAGASGRDTVSRWRLEFQNDFAARMDWTQASYANANHNPVAQINVPNQITVSAGQSVSIDASNSWDPDGDPLSYEWFQYREAGTYPNSVTLANANAARVRFQAPNVSSPQTIHLILKLRDNGAPNLFDYQRVIVTVRPAAGSATSAPERSTPSSTGPVLELRFDEASGSTANDYSGRGNHAELMHTESSDWVPGDSGRAVRLDDTNEYVRVRQSATWASRQANLSVSAWVKFDDLRGVDYKPIISVGNWSDQRLYVYPVNGRLQFSAASDGWKTGVLSSPLSFLQQPDDQFHHIVAVKDEASQSASLYVDGVLVGRDDYASGSVDLRSDDLTFCGNASQQISCVLDGAALYHEALSSSRVAELQQAGRASSPPLSSDGSRISPKAVIDLIFSEGSGSTVADQSGNGNTGLLVNVENADWIAGQSGGAVRLDHVDERVRVRSTSSWASPQKSFSISTWVKLEQLAGTNYDSIVSVGNWSDQRINVYPVDGRLQFVARSTGWGTSVQSDTLPFLQNADGRFHHIVVVKDNANQSASLYVDGKLAGHDPYSSGTVDLRGYDFSLCGDSSGRHQIACVLDGATLYHGALDAGMVSQLYAAAGGNLLSSSGSQSPVVDLKFNEGAGKTTQDLSGNGNTGLIFNTESSDWVDTSTVSALQLDGVNEQVRVRPSSSWSQPQADFTLSVWLKFDDPAYNNYTSVASVGSWKDQRLNLYRADGRLHFVASSNESGTSITSPHFSFLWWPDGQYHHVVAVKDSATESASLYVDGQLVGTDSHAIGTVDLRGWDLTFGGNSAGNKMMPITLAEAMFFDRALSEVEIEQLDRDFWN